MMVCAAISVEVDLVVIVCFLVVLVSRVNLTEIGHCEIVDVELSAGAPPFMTSIHRAAIALER